MAATFFLFGTENGDDHPVQFKSDPHLLLSTSTHDDDLGSLNMSEKRARDTCEPRLAMASEPTVHGSCAQTQSDLSMRNVHNALQARGQGLDVLFGNVLRSLSFQQSVSLNEYFLWTTGHAHKPNVL